MAKVFGIISSTLPTGITGQVIGDASITGDIGDTKDLVGNPSSTIADSRTGTPNIRKMTVNFAFATGDGADVASYTLLGSQKRGHRASSCSNQRSAQKASRQARQPLCHTRLAERG